ncbi:MAG TPA: cyclic nucleotide-binding domain-containing protein, partial [Nitrospiria bacterium]|nr:cyclic nucleotide-binding domain-containing protein [Nitrospiria bacterium]
MGGGDSAIEIALSLAEQNRVSMAVRTSEFIRVKDSLERQALEKAKKGQLNIYFNSSVERIEPEMMKLKLSQSTIDVKATVVIAKIGTVPPRSFLEKCGIAFPSQDREATPLLSASYETNVPGLFLIGAVGGKELIKHGINQGYEVVEHLCGRPVEPADEALLRQKLGITAGTVSGRIQELLPMTPVLSGGTEAQIRELLLFSQFHRVQPGEIVFRQNDFSESLYMILEGRVELLVKPDDGPEKSVATLGPGEFLGEMSLISGRRRSATVRAVSEGLLWEVTRKAMLKFIYTTPAAKKFIDQIFLIHAFQSYLFPNLDHDILVRLASQAEVLKFDKGKIIIKEGDPGDAFYLLRSGMVKVSKMREDQEIVLAYLAAGQYFGEMALLNNAPRAATVAAIDKVEVIKL